jgi:hypothetical protein
LPISSNLGLIHALGGDLESALETLNRARDIASPGEIEKVSHLLESIQKVLVSQKQP